MSIDWGLEYQQKKLLFGWIEQDDVEDEVMGGSFNPIHLGHALLESGLAWPAVFFQQKI